MEGMQIGRSEERHEVITLLVSSGMPYAEISSRLKMPLEDIKRILATGNS
jgi:DNA-directed RNA polymerase specialized sigma24 family protein